MPCNSDYLNPTTREIELSRVACLLDELAGMPINQRHWSGQHPLVYGQHVDGDGLVRALCARLQDIDVSRRSLEMQIWWRDHQAADAARLQREVEATADDAARAAAIGKLTPHERKLLKLK